MAEVRQVPLEEYENMKKSYGLTDEQMRSVMNVEPLKTRWADGYGESRKKDEEISVKDRHQQLVNEIRSRLENGQVEVKPEVKETAENPVQNEVKVDDVPAFSEPETKVEEVPSFAMLQEEMAEEVPSFSMPQENSVADVPEFSVPSVDFSSDEIKKAEAELDLGDNIEFAVPEFTPVMEEVIENMSDVPAFSEPETKVDEVPSFAMPQEEVVSTPTDNTEIALSDDISKSRDEMFEMGKNKLLELLKMDNQLSKSTDFSR
ncbi:MAG: hypothetical protein K6F04_03555 [bacterium]|nr:hypothetical protein [bacterium]